MPIIEEILAQDRLDAKGLHRIVRRYPKDGCGVFSKSDIIRAFRHFARRYGWSGEAEFVERLKMKPVRTQSGVATVTVLTAPYPCPGRCIFCPSDVRMPKSYLSREPGAQRAARHDFDPYAQTLSRLAALHNNGHRLDKVELIILGGTWSCYPEAYQVGFVRRCFEALNDFDPSRRQDFDRQAARPPAGRTAGRSFSQAAERVDGRTLSRTYNQIVSGPVARRNGLRPTGLRIPRDGPPGEAPWAELRQAQGRNEGSACRCVGLVVETRPDHLTVEEAIRIRRLGATKVQIGVQSLSDEVLAKNRRGHDVAATRRAFALLRQAGFKLHAHWMPNLYGSDPDRDVEDFDRLFADPGFRPDELKIYPCSLIESAELMQHYESGRWRPYTRGELLRVLSKCLSRVPPWCRVTRMVRDIPGDDIFAGNRTTNFRQLVEAQLRREGRDSRDIRAREIGREPVDPAALRLRRMDYETSTGREVFLQIVTAADRIVGFCRLALPARPADLGEIVASAMLREVHVYGVVVGIGDQRPGHSQHLGLGRELIEEAAAIAAKEGFADLAVISSVGTREYYRRLGFGDGELYQHRALDISCHNRLSSTSAEEEQPCAE